MGSPDVTARSEWLDNEVRAREECRSVASSRQENYRGEGPPRYKIGKRTLYKRSEVEAWRLSRRVAS